MQLVPTDRLVIRGLCIFFVVIFAVEVFFFAIRAWSLFSRDGVDSWIFGGYYAVGAIAAAPAAVALGLTLRCRAVSPRAALRRLWTVVRCVFALIGAVTLYLAIASAIVRPEFPQDVDFTGYLVLTVMFVASAILPTDRRRGALVRRLGALGRHGDTELQRAAAVASLCGGQTPAAVLARATSLFRAIPVGSLDPEDLRSSDATEVSASSTAATSAAAASSTAGTRGPRPLLAARSTKALLGQVDAFMSHAWADEEVAPGRKFAALKGWAASFEQSERRPPKIWLDKACIAQDNINESLACLPCFLAGCRKLLVIAGESYTTRLWCVMEVSRPHRLCAPPALTHSCPLQVFTFLQMGKSTEEIEVIPIGKSHVTLDLILERFREFRGEAAQCYRREDREHLLAVIESTFGDFEHFNTVVRGVFEARQRPSLAKLSTAGSLGASRSQLSVPESSSERPSVVSPHTPHVLSSRTEPSASTPAEVAAVEVRVV